MLSANTVKMFIRSVTIHQTINLSQQQELQDQAFSTPVEDSKIFCPLTATEKMNTIFLLSIEFTGCFKFYFPDCVT